MGTMLRMRWRDSSTSGTEEPVSQITNVLRLLPTVTRAPLWTHLWDQSASEVWLESADLSSGSGSSLELSSCSSSEVSSAASVVDSANAFSIACAVVAETRATLPPTLMVDNLALLNTNNSHKDLSF